MITKNTLDEASWKLYRLEIEKRQLEKVIDELRESILNQMNMLHQDSVITDDFTIEKTSSVKYGLPSPDQLREVLGKAASKYIIETVDPKVRLDLPLQVSMALCPVIRKTEYIRTKLRIDNGKTNHSS